MKDNTTANPTDLNLSFTPPSIQGFDYAALEAWAKGIAEQYQGLVVTEDQVVGIKSEMAHLNAIKKKLDDSRKEAVKVVSAPIEEFKAQIKAVCDIFDNTYAALSEQVKNHEERAREIKRTEVLFAIETLTAEAGYPGLFIPVQDSWLNKTQKPKATADAIKAIIADHIKAEKDAAALEQAKQDRAVAIEQQCAALGQGYGFALPVSQFLKLHDLSLALVDVHESITAAYRAKADQMDRENVAPVPPAASPAPVDAFGRRPLAEAPHPVQEQPQGSPVQKNITVSLRFAPFRENDVNAALRHLEELGVSVVLVTPVYESREIIPTQRARNY